MKKLLVITAMVSFLLGFVGALFAQPAGTMYTLDDIYYYLTEGVEATEGGDLEPPAGAVPGDTRFKTLKQIYEGSKAQFEMCDLTLADLQGKGLTGKTFFSTDTDAWGPTEISEPPWELNETTCNALTGWTWINGACWSQAIADSVSWNKGVGNDTSTTGTYEPNTGGDLKSRMEALVAGQWSEICTSINGRAITSGDDGAAGKPYISALAIADCVDGARDLGPTISGSDWQSRSNTLKAWATAAGKSALPAVDYNGANNEFEDACTGDFYLNTSILAPGTNYSLGAACGDPSGDGWSTDARTLGYLSCSFQEYDYTSSTNAIYSFRVVVRPAAE